MNSKTIVFTLLVIFALGFVACNDDNDSSDAARLTIRLTDGPADYEEVNVDIQDVQINPSGSNDGWISLEDVNTGVYNLLELTNGLDVVLADVELPAGPLTQLRLVLGDNNTIKIVNENAKALKTPSAQQSGLKIQLNTELEAGVAYTILLDFDVARSIVEAGNSGQTILKPVIRATTEATSGSIKGNVVPNDTQHLIYAIMGLDTLSTYTNENGDFLVRSVPAGMYRVEVVPETDSGLELKTVPDVEVTIGQVTDVGIINLEN